MRRDIPKNVDPLLLFGRPKAGRGRRRSFAFLLVAFAVVVGGLALIAYLAWPAPDPPRLAVVAFDALGVPDASVSVRAVVRPQFVKDRAADVDGRPILFVDPGPPAQPGKKPVEPRRATVSTRADGEAIVAWSFGRAGPPWGIVARYAGDDQSPRPEDMSHVFIWPATERLLVVEARYGLMNASEVRFQKNNVLALRPFAGAREALGQARAKWYRIVYLAVAPDRPADYRRLRGWLQRSENGFPEGPALGRPSYHGDAGEADLAPLLRALKEKFREPIIAVAGRSVDARALAGESARTFLIGEQGALPANGQRLKAWADLAGKLP
jgi:hypothetical protein